MKLWSTSVCGLALLGLSFSVTGWGAPLSLDELRGTRAGGDWVNCTHKGPATGNCDECLGRIKCDYRKWLGCEPWVSQEICLRCKTINSACPGNKTVYQNDACDLLPAVMGTCAARIWQNINVDNNCMKDGVPVPNCPPK
jgi:hypothetical protein